VFPENAPEKAEPAKAFESTFSIIPPSNSIGAAPEQGRTAHEEPRNPYESWQLRAIQAQEASGQQLTYQDVARAATEFESGPKPSTPDAGSLKRQTYGIPAMFLPDVIAIEDDDECEQPAKKPCRRPLVPVHKGAKKANFESMKKPAAATHKKPAAAPAVGGGSKVQVKYTYPLHPVRTYCQAYLVDKWVHVVTVTEKQHAQHKAIVTHIGEEVRLGKKSLGAAKKSRKKHLASWPQ